MLILIIVLPIFLLIFFMLVLALIGENDALQFDEDGNVISCACDYLGGMCNYHTDNP